MVENKTETDNYQLGNFLNWNVETCNLESFYDSVGWSKDRYNSIITQQDEADNKCARLARSNDLDGPSSLQLIYSLFIRKDLEARPKGREEHGDALPSGADLLCLIRFSLCYFIYIIMI